MNLKNIIRDHKKTPMYLWYKWGEDYYNSDNTHIKSRVKESVYARTHHDGTISYFRRENPGLANHKLPSGYLKKIVDQKVQYLLGNGITITEEEDERAEEVFKEIFIDELDELVSDVGTTASKKIVGWVKAYIEDNMIKFVEIMPEQIIQYTDGHGNIIKLLRFYVTFDENLEETTKVEVWDEDTITVYQLKDDEYEICNERSPHMVLKEVMSDGTIISQEEHSWGRVPFIPFYNNKAKTSDLKPIKPFIDIYDIVNSDFANNIDDMQDAFYVIKNYGGQNLDEFVKQLKDLKVVPVGEGGDVDTKELKIPVEARDTFLKLTKDNIYEFGMAVNTADLKGGSITNVVIKAMFADLDLKADQFEVQVTKFLKEMTWFINWWLVNIRSQSPIMPNFTYNRSLIVNEVELLAANVEQTGNISEKTKLSNHPWVKNVEKEIEQTKEEQEEILSSIDNNMGFNE